MRLPTYSASEKLNWLIGFTRIGLFSITYILTGSLDLFRGSLALAYIDPYNLEYLSFSIIQRLAKLQSIDFAVHFSTMDLTRNIDLELNPQRGRFDHTLPGWRTKVPSNELSKASLPSWFFNQWCGAIESLGFKISHQMPLISNGQGSSIYRLVFFSRHPLADRIWGDVAKERNLSLF
ncbi:hypothetical protein CHR62_15220 [Pusillimonas sp. NJUB218]|nr:hypothetical protein CHR62_15220 [Pusillimonas sp. NJUB218]